MSKVFKEGEATHSNYSVGVIVGRFQIPKLHSEHKTLFDYVCSKHKKVICYLGLNPIMGSSRDPLDFHQRKVMINEDYPDVQCMYIKDAPDNETWADNLDTQINDLMLPMQKPLLYGSRDSFIKAYVDGGGKYDCEELESKSFVSATQIREEASRGIVANYFVRLGMVLASFMRYPTSYTTVDVAIMDNKRTRVLLGRKKNQKLFRFVGGFTDPGTDTIEADAKREVLEETHIILSEPEYLFSMKVADWRYRDSKDAIKTTFWIGDRIGGDPEADDDIVEVRWYDLDSFKYPEGTAPFGVKYDLKDIVKEHKPLMEKFLDIMGEKV